MVLKSIFIAAALMLAACQSAALSDGNAVATPPIIDPTPTPHWLETTIHGITLGMWQPEGWETVVSDGLIVAERVPGQIAGNGMLIYVFVPALDELGISPTSSNLAWSLLDQVVHMPSHTGRDLVMSEPTRFTWGSYNAAYYLLTTGDGMRAVVLALAIPGQQKVVVCNVSSPSSRANQIRAMLPQLFDGLRIDGQTLSGAPLDTLPDPLPFPSYSSARSVRRQMNVSSSSP